jgi:beta-galactosidase
MAHILPHWTWPERVGEVTPVHVFTSGDEGELFINGKSQGRRKKGQYEYRLRWDEVKYQPGEVKVVTYRNGKAWASAIAKTAGDPARIELKPDRPQIRADGSDLSFVTVRITDASDVTAPRADNRVRFTIEGPGEIVATDNGDATSFESFQSPERIAFNGYCVVIVRGKPGEQGKITLSAESPSLRRTSVALQTVHWGRSDR